MTFGNKKICFQEFFFQFQGDSAYTLSPWLMKIIQNNVLTEAETNFNNRLKTVRQLIERVIGVLKMRFRCIMSERQLRYSPTKVGRIVYTCATLHNFLLSRNFDMLNGIDANIIRNVNNEDEILFENNNENLRRGTLRRNQLVEFLQ